MLLLLLAPGRWSLLLLLLLSALLLPMFRCGPVVAIARVPCRHDSSLPLSAFHAVVLGFCDVPVSLFLAFCCFVSWRTSCCWCHFYWRVLASNFFACTHEHNLPKNRLILNVLVFQIADINGLSFNMMRSVLSRSRTHIRARHAGYICKVKISCAPDCNGWD